MVSTPIFLAMAGISKISVLVSNALPIIVIVSFVIYMTLSRKKKLFYWRKAVSDLHGTLENFLFLRDRPVFISGLDLIM